MTTRLHLLDQRRGAVMTALPDGSELTVLIEGCSNPDGIVVDGEGGFLYWTNIGPTADQADGSIERSRLDGSERTVIVPTGATRTPKQLRLDAATGHLYWCDREGMRLMRASLNGSSMETLLATGDADIDRGDATRWCVGMTLDLDRRQIYWTQKGRTSGGQGRIFRALMDLRDGADSISRRDIELLIDHLPEPVDLELSADGHSLYWTDRAHTSGGNSLNRGALDPLTGALGDLERLVDGMDQPIGMTIDFAANRMFAADLGGNLYTGDLDGRGWTRLLSDAGEFTGICHL